MQVKKGGDSMKRLLVVGLLLYGLSMQAVIKIGHRGACGYAPENTLLSFEKAIELGVDMIELDVHVCKSGELVVIHEDKVDDTTNGTGYIIDLTLDQLKQLDAGDGEKIPTLQEVFECVNRRVKIDIELKGESTPVHVAEFIKQYVAKGWRYSDFIVTSFNHYFIQEFQQLLPDVFIGALYTGVPIGYAQAAQKLQADAIIASWKFITQAFVDDAHARGMQVFVYTVDHPDDVIKMKQLGVDGICSNYPDRV